MTEPTMERQVSEIHRIVEVGFARTDGKLDILTQRMDHQAEAATKLGTQVERHDEEIDEVKRTYLPRAEFTAYCAQQEAKEAEKSRLRPVWVGVTLTAAALLSGTTTAIVMPLVTK